MANPIDVGTLTGKELELLKVVLGPKRFAAITMKDLVQSKGETKPDFYMTVIKSRIPCAYGSKTCEGKRFAPNGRGSTMHTTCKKGAAALKAFQQSQA